METRLSSRAIFHHLDEPSGHRTPHASNVPIRQPAAAPRKWESPMEQIQSSSRQRQTQWYVPLPSNKQTVGEKDYWTQFRRADEAATNKQVNPPTNMPIEEDERRQNDWPRISRSPIVQAEREESKRVSFHLFHYLCSF